MISTLSAVAQVHTAMVFRNQPPQEDPSGNVRALAIRNLVASVPFHWTALPRVTVDTKFMAHCLRVGDIVIPSRGDYYYAWLFEGADEPIFPLGQLNVIRTAANLSPHYLVWYLNRKTTQTKISQLLTGSSIQALTKASLLTIPIEVPSLRKQHEISELDSTTRRILALRHRLNELDKAETAFLTQKCLEAGDPP